MKRIVSLFLAMMLLSTTAFASDGDLGDYTDEPKFATEYYTSDIYEPLDEVQATSAANALDSIKAKSAVLIDITSGTVLYEKNSHEIMPPASITKIMTLILVMEAIENGKISLEDEVSVSDHAASMGGSQIWLEPNEKMTVNDLLKATCVASANDAAVALGEYIAGSEDAFVSMMNDRAAELGMKDTTFINATGLDAEGHLTTAYDISLMSRALIRHDLIKKYSTIWMDSLRDGETELVNTNRLVRFYEGTTGLKTGTTDGAGSCLSATAERQGLALCAVVMGCDTSNDRFNSARTLLDYGFANWAMYKFEPKLDEVKSVKVISGVKDLVGIALPEAKSFLIPKGKGENIVAKTEISESVEAGVEQGQVLGKIILTLDGETIGEYPLCADKSVEKMTFKNAFSLLFSQFFKL